MEKIAIIGMAGVFPEARDINEYWDNLVKGKDCIYRDVPDIIGMIYRKMLQFMRQVLQVLISLRISFLHLSRKCPAIY